jgi:4-hydroxythreonine-4-phosphate dehydrogenase (EC 1.1.1.262)
LNPHAGDNGLLGKEEETIIIPAMEEMDKQGVLSFGPMQQMDSSVRRIMINLTEYSPCIMIRD